MFNEFRLSWDLFRYTYISGWAIGLLLSVSGVFIVAKDQIFIGAAISQASTLGIAAALAAGSIFGAGSCPCFHSQFFIAAMAVLFSIAASVITSRKKERGHESEEAVTGWIFLLSSGLSILVVSKSPHGLEEINRLLSSSIIGATFTDAALFCFLFIVTAAFVYKFHRHITLLAIDAEMAAALGLKAGRWNFLLSAWLGLIIALSIRVSGMLFVFGCLVLPAMISKSFCREIKTMFWLAPAIAAAVNVSSFIIANSCDFPPAQLSISLMAVMLPFAWGVKKWKAAN